MAQNDIALTTDTHVNMDTELAEIRPHVFILCDYYSRLFSLTFQVNYDTH